nr:hypothetical protein [Salinibacter sp.]
MTQMTRRAPTRTLRPLQREVDDLFDQFFGRTDGGDQSISAVWSPSTDLVETDDAFRLHLDVPGMSAPLAPSTARSRSRTPSTPITSRRPTTTAY